MSKEVVPALTAFEWGSGYESKDISLRIRGSMFTEGPRLDVTVRGHPLGGALGGERDLHALAACALHGQPFGFTRADVDELRGAFPDPRRGEAPAPSVDLKRLWDLRARIDALLPPGDL